MKRICAAIFGLSLCVLSAWSQQVTNTIPGWSQNSVGLASNIIAYFSSALRDTTVTTNTFFLDGAMSGRKNGSITFNAATNQVTLDPFVHLRPGEWMSAHLTRGILSASGAEATPFQWSWHNAASGVVGKTQIYYKRYGISGSFGICTNVEMGDVNGDGFLDTVGDWNGFRWFCLNDGTGGFFPGHEYSVSDRQGRGNRLGDLDGDGDLDLVDLNINGSDVGVCLNNGSLPFDFSESVCTYTNTFDGLSLADMNGDGSLDLWVGADRTSRIFTNNGSAHFTLSQTIADGATNGLAGILTDLNGDGSVDAWRLSPVDLYTRIWTNNGAGVLSSAGDFAYQWTECRPGDFNNDRKVDVAYANGFYINIVTNDGHGAFGPFFSSSFATNGPIQFELGDMDGDGDLDLAGIQQDANNPWMRVMLNNGTFFSLVETNLCGYDGRLSDVDIGDVDGDGTLDVVVSCVQSKGAVFLNTYPSWSVLGMNGQAMSPAAPPSVASGTELGVVPIGKVITNTFTVSNQTVVDFAFSTSLTDTNGGPGGASFFYTQPTSTYYTARQSNLLTTFSIVYTPVNEGDHWARVRLTDSGTNTFDIFMHATCSGFIVTNTQPRNGMPGVAPGGNITAQFSSPLLASSVTSNRFLAWGNQSGLHRGSFSFNATSNQVTLDPTADFRCGETVFAVMPDEITSAAGHPMMPYSWSFRAAITNTACAALFADLGQRPGTNDARAAAMGDLNSDGWLDLFVANYENGSEVWLNSGTGSLANSGQRIGTNLNSTSVALGDLDHDGDLDAILTSWQQSNTVWMNNGSGTFTLNQTLSQTSMGRKVVLADFDNDTDLDAFILNDGETNVVWQNTSGTFGSILSRPGCHAGRDAVAGDFNGDGKTDLFIVNDDFASQVWTNDGAGGFTVSSNVHPEGGISAATGDLDNDNDLDIVIGCTNGPAITYRNDGSGGFGTTFANNIPGTCGAVQLGCLDGDADLELMRLRADGGESSVWLNYGGGVLQENTLQMMGVVPTPKGVELGDIDNDGDLDVVLVLGTNGVRALINTRAGMGILATNGTAISSGEAASEEKGTHFGTLSGGSVTNWFVMTNTSPVNMEVQDITTSAVMTVQFQLINSPSVVTAHSSVAFGVAYHPIAMGTQTVTFAFGGSWTGGTFQLAMEGVYAPPLQVSNTAPHNAELAVAGDATVTAHFNGPVNPDTVTTNTFLLWSVFRGKLSGTVTVGESNLFATFTPAADFLPGETVFAEATSGILSEDNSCPLPARIWSFTAAVPKGSGLFTTSAVSSSWGQYMTPTEIALADFDGDGDLDGAVTMDGATNYILQILLNDGAANFATNGQAFPRNYADVEGLATGDLDGDGDLDMIVGDYALNPYVFWNDGNAQFTMQTNLFEMNGLAWPAIGDLDGDGDQDVMLCGEDQRDTVWLNDGAGNFTLSPHYLNKRLFNPKLADLDGDGDLDVVASANNDYFVETVYALINNGEGIFSIGTTLTYSRPGIIHFGPLICLGDLDADGDVDLAYRGIGAACRAWLNDGNASFATSSLPYPANSYGFAMGDLNADNALDVLIGNTSYTPPYPVFNDGHAGFSNGAITSNAAEVVLFALGDLDGNGTLDALNSGLESARPPTVLLNRSIPGMLLLSTNGAAIADGSAADSDRGTRFGHAAAGSGWTNVLSITNGGTEPLVISGYGLSDAAFQVSGLPDTVAARSVSNFSLIFSPDAAGACSAVLTLTNNADPSPYEVNLAGACYEISTNAGPVAGSNTVTVSNGYFGTITNVLVGETAATLADSGTNWFTITMPSATTNGPVNILIQTSDNGNIPLVNAYTYEYPTLVVLYDFHLSEENGQIQVCWETASEEDAVGFDLYRWTSDTWIKVNDSMIQTQGQDGLGASYCIADAGADATNTFRYKLVETETSGSSEEYGPFDVSAWTPRLENLSVATNGVVIRWLGREQDTYEIHKTTNLVNGYEPLTTGLPGSPPVNSFTDQVENAGAAYYRIRVE